MTKEETRALINERLEELRINTLPDRVSNIEISLEKIKGDIATLRAELKGDNAYLRAELKEDIAELKGMNKVMLRVMLIIMSFMLAAVVKYLFFS